MIDTIQIARDLVSESSLTQRDSEAIVQAVVKIQAADLATKVDIADVGTEIEKVRTEIAKVKADLIYWIVGSVGLSTLLQLAASFMRH